MVPLLVIDLSALTLAPPAAFEFVGVAVFCLWTWKRMPSAGVVGDARWLLVGLVVGMVVGRRASSMATAVWSDDGRSIIERSGLVALGGVLGGVLETAAVGLVAEIRTRELFDAAGPPLLMSLAIGRIGDLLDGRPTGLPAAVPWAIVQAPTGPLSVPRHPTMGYEALVLAGLTFLVLVLSNRRPVKAYPGTLFAITLLAYAATRITMAGLTVNRVKIADLPGQAVVGVLVVVACLAFLVWVRLRADGGTLQRPFPP
jgi:prolipoprotein diacylglyceryltransferase